MKRTRIEPEDVTDWPVLIDAFHRAAKGKRDRPAVVAFARQFESSLNSVQEALLCARLPVGRYRRFQIRDPKPRIIHAAPFADRVAHHALMTPLAKPLDDWQPATSFACRPGLGVHRLVHYAQRQCRRYAWYLQLDIAGYFATIDHEVLMRLLHRRFRGAWSFRMIEAVLDSYGNPVGRGLPIGALTSQHFANTYLVPSDHWLGAQPECAAHARYMDDIVVWTTSRHAAEALLARYREWLPTTLRLTLKPAIIQPTRHGLSLCGCRIRAERIRPSRRRQRRFRRQLDTWETAYLNGDITEARLQRQVDALLSTLLPADSLAWRRSLFARRAFTDHPPVAGEATSL